MEHLSEAHKTDISNLIIDKLEYQHEIDRLVYLGLHLKQSQTEQEQLYKELQDHLDDEQQDLVHVYHQLVEQDKDFMLEEIKSLIRTLMFEIQTRDDIIQKKQQLLDACSVECDMCQLFQSDEDIKLKILENMKQKINLRMKFIRNLFQQVFSKAQPVKTPSTKGYKKEELNQAIQHIKDEIKQIESSKQPDVFMLQKQFTCNGEMDHSLLSIQFKLQALQSKELSSEFIDQNIKQYLQLIDEDIKNVDKLIVQINEYKNHLMKLIFQSSQKQLDINFLVILKSELTKCLEYLRTASLECVSDLDVDCKLSKLFLYYWCKFEHEEAVQKIQTCSSELLRYQTIEIDLMQVYQSFGSLLPSSILPSQIEVDKAKQQIMSLQDKTKEEIKSLRQRLKAYDELLTRIEGSYEMEQIIQSITQVPDSHVFQTLGMYLLNADFLQRLVEQFYQNQQQHHDSIKATAQQMVQVVPQDTLEAIKAEGEKLDDHVVQVVEVIPLTEAQIIQNIKDQLIDNELPVSVQKYFEMSVKKIDNQTTNDAIKSLSKFKHKIMDFPAILNLIQQLISKLESRPQHVYQVYFDLLNDVLGSVSSDKQVQKYLTQVQKVQVPIKDVENILSYFHMIKEFIGLLQTKLKSVVEQDDLVHDFEDAIATLEILQNEIIKDHATLLVQPATPTEEKEQTPETSTSKPTEPPKQQIELIHKQIQTIQKQLKDIEETATKKQLKECNEHQDMLKSIEDFFQEQQSQIDIVKPEDLQHDIDTAKHEISRAKMFIKRL